MDDTYPPECEGTIRACRSTSGDDRAVEVTAFQAMLARLRNGDAAAAVEVCRRYSPFIRAAVRRHLNPGLRPRFDSLDFVQDVWASFLATPPGRYVFDSPHALIGFLTRVAHHKVVEAFRNRFATQGNNIGREVPAPEPGAEHPLPSSAPSPSQWAIAGEQWARLLDNVPAGHRVIVRLLRDGHNYEDIARITNVSLSTVNRVVRRLKELTGL